MVAAAALDEGADAIVLNAVDAELAEELVVAAGDVPVIAYDRFVAGADRHVQGSGGLHRPRCAAKACA